MSYRRFLVALCVYLIVLVYPFLIVVLNFPPERASLKEMSIRVIRASMAHPNLIALDRGGVIKEFDFPSTQYDIFRGFGRGYGKVVDVSALSGGCVGQVLVDKVKFIPFNSHFRVWSLSCGGVHMGYEQTTSFYKGNFLWELLITVPIHLGAWLILFLNFYSDRRKV